MFTASSTTSLPQIIKPTSPKPIYVTIFKFEILFISILPVPSTLEMEKT